MYNNTFRAVAIDVGTNSIKMVVGEIDSAGEISFLHESSSIVRLGECIQETGAISEASLKRAVAAISKFLDEAASFDVQSIQLVGTSALRDASNSAYVLDEIQNKLNVEIKIIPESQEALYAYSSVKNDPLLSVLPNSFAITDVGGGSSEIIYGDNSSIITSSSINIGAIKITERFLNVNPIPIDNIISAKSYIKNLIQASIKNITPKELICIGGTAINLAHIVNRIPIESTDNIHAKIISIADVNKAVETLSNMTLNQRRLITGLDPKRADIIIGGILIIESFASEMKLDQIKISIRGLRHALLYDLLRTGR